MKIKLIGIAGLARSGKDTTADYLVGHHRFKRISLAEPLKTGLCAMLGIGLDRFDGPAKEQIIPWIGRSPRELAQTLGTEWGRELVAGDIWLRVAERRIVAAHTYGHMACVVPDLRYDNECEWLRELGGQVWHIRRDGAPTVRAHKSEDGVSVLPGDKLIDNNGSLAGLHQQIAQLMGMHP